MLTSFLATSILKAIEEDFIVAEPEIQAILLANVKLLSDDLLRWIDKKLELSKSQVK
jgi:hypothetical protein